MHGSFRERGSPPAVGVERIAALHRGERNIHPGPGSQHVTGRFNRIPHGPPLAVSEEAAVTEHKAALNARSWAAATAAASPTSALRHNRYR